MPIQSDYHVHSEFSSDSKTPMEEMIKKAVSLGLKRICFTDHMDLDFPKQYEHSFVFHPLLYFDKINKLSEQYKKDIHILTGIELGLKPDLAERHQQLLAQYPWDFAIGSTHIINGIDPYYPEFWEGYTQTEAIRKYFELTLENIQSTSYYDVLGHLDYIIRYAPSKTYSYLTYADVIDEILRTLIQNGKGMEVNTSGYKAGLQGPNPKIEIVSRYIQLGGELLTIGSDGHTPEYLAFEFEQVKRLLLSIGIRHYTIYEKRKPIFLDL